MPPDAQTTITRAEAAYAAGRYAEAATLFSMLLEAVEKTSGPDGAAVIAPLNQLACCYRQLGRLLDAGPMYQRALILLQTHGRGQSEQAADILHNLGALEFAAGNWLRGEPFAREAVRIRTRLLGRQALAVARDVAALAALVDRQGRFVEAERLYARALPVLGRGSGEGHHLVAVVLNNLGAIRQARGRLADAEGLFRRACALETAQAGASHPHVAFSTNNLAVLLAQTRRPGEAAPLFRRAIGLFRKAQGSRHPNVAVCLENYAAVLRRLGRPAEARAAAARAAGIFAGVDAVNHHGVAVTGTVNPLRTPYRLRVKPSAIHRVGLFSDQAIPRAHKVIEYTGELISHRESGRRWDPKRSYLFELNERWHLDGAIGGSGAEYINHSCDPNLKTRILGDHIIYFSLRPIRKGEELTVDYRYDWDSDVMPCSCGAATCRGTMNLPSA